MTKLQFTKATKEQAKLRLALFGPSGAGKTYTALRMATGMGGNIAVIDTERGSASKYADRFEFDVLELDTRNIATYCQAIGAANRAGYNVLIIDSLTHAWQELLADIDKIAKTRYRGNRWSAWSDGTPMQHELIDTLLSCNCHIIATMRSKTEWATQDENGKIKPVRIGLAPEQGKGIEYEFDMLMELSPDHVAVVLKDRTGKYQDEMIELPGEDFGKALADWLKEGKPAKKKKARKPQQQQDPERQRDELIAKYSYLYYKAVDRGMAIEPLDTSRATPAEITAAVTLLEDYLVTERPYSADRAINGSQKNKGLRRAAGWEKTEMGWRPQPDNEAGSPVEKERQRAAALLNKALHVEDDKEETKARRYKVTARIFGHESTENLTALEVQALLAWAEREPGSWETNPFVAAEAAEILALEDIGLDDTQPSVDDNTDYIGG
jgi:hypothetical protein